MAFKEGVVIGTVSLNATGSGTTAIGATSNSGTIAIGNTSSGAVSVDCGTAGLTLGTTANAHTTTLGSTNSTSATTVQSGSGALALTSTNGTWTGNSGTGNLGLSTDASATTVSLATGAAVKAVTLGSTNSTSATTIQSGSSALTLTTNGGNANIVLTPNGTGVVTTANNLRAASISFDSGSNLLANYVGFTSYTPTALGGTTAGTTTYTIQNGYYVRIGSLIFVQFVVQYSAATGTGNIQISLPFTANSSSNANVVGTVAVQGGSYTWPNTNTTNCLYINPGTNVAIILGTKSASNGAFFQMENTQTTINGTICFSL